MRLKDNSGLEVGPSKLSSFILFIALQFYSTMTSFTLTAGNLFSKNIEKFDSFAYIIRIKRC